VALGEKTTTTYQNNLLRSGFTTGTCAAAAAKAAAVFICSGKCLHSVSLVLPGGDKTEIPIVYVKAKGCGAEAAVRKDAGSDPDITHGAIISAFVYRHDGTEVILEAGKGVGTVTKPGLSVPVGKPAINPVPERMIKDAVHSTSDGGFIVVVSIEGGKELALKTFNPRLGITGGLSILGTSGRVRPFSAPALQDSLKCAIDVAAASRITAPVFVPGHIGERAANSHLKLAEGQVIEVSNKWGFILDYAAQYSFESMLALGHPGKLAKLAFGDWDTHSSCSQNAVPFVLNFAENILHRSIAESNTVEGIFASLQADEKINVGSKLAKAVQKAIFERVGGKPSVILIDIRGEILGKGGSTALWEENG